MGKIKKSGASQEILYHLFHWILKKWKGDFHETSIFFSNIFKKFLIILKWHPISFMQAISFLRLGNFFYSTQFLIFSRKRFYLSKKRKRQKFMSYAVLLEKIYKVWFLRKFTFKNLRKTAAILSFSKYWKKNFRFN